MIVVAGGTPLGFLGSRRRQQHRGPIAVGRQTLRTRGVRDAALVDGFPQGAIVAGNILGSDAGPLDAEVLAVVFVDPSRAELDRSTRLLPPFLLQGLKARSKTGDFLDSDGFHASLADTFAGAGFDVANESSNSWELLVTSRADQFLLLVVNLIIRLAGCAA